jgi:hypothetical protein
MNPNEYLSPPVPVDSYDAQRWQESRRRRRLLEGMWGVDLEHRIRLHFGIVRRMILGPKSKSRNLYRRLVTELSVLYRTPPKVANRYGGADALLAPDGMLARSGIWPQMRSVQTYALGVREEAVRVEFDPITCRPAYRQVHADNLCGRSRALDPGVPVELRELRWYELEGRGRWAWDILSVEDPDRPFYRIEEVRVDGREGQDITRLVLGREVSGDAYPYRWTQGPRRGQPFLPYVLYHADISSQLFDPYSWIELADAALDVAAAWTWWGHLLFKASWPQRYGIDVYVEGMIPEETDGGLRTEVPADASSLIHLRTRSGAVNPQVGQWQPSADILSTAQAIGLFERGCSDIAGIDAAHIVRESSDAWSGAALSISRDGKREAQALYQPQFEPRDIELLEKSAALVNLSETLAAPLPEEGYRVLYAPIGLAYQELEQRRRHHTELIEKGRMSVVEAYQEEHPGMTADEAKQALVDAQISKLKIDSEAAQQAEAQGLVAKQAKELSGIVIQSGLDILSRLKLGEINRVQAINSLKVLIGLTDQEAEQLVPPDAVSDTLQVQPAQAMAGSTAIEAEAEGEQEEADEPGESEDMPEGEDEDEPTGEVPINEVHQLVLDALEDDDIEAAKRILKGSKYAVSSTD